MARNLLILPHAAPAELAGGDSSNSPIFRKKENSMSTNATAIQSILPALLAGIFAASAQAAETVLPAISPTTMSISNPGSAAVYVNLVLSQKPPAGQHPGCPTLGTWITTVNDPNLVFASSVPNKIVAFTPQAKNITDKGFYKLAAGETITYQAKIFNCGAQQSCTPSLSGNVFFTQQKYYGAPNNGCGNPTFPNGTNLAEFSLNYALNGAQGASCARADAVDISAVNGVNAKIVMQMSGNQWSNASISNKALGQNFNLPGVFGWAATTCQGDAGYPNPGPNCAAPAKAPKPVSGVCAHGGSLITFGKQQYCAEVSPSSNNCVVQRAANVTGGAVAIQFKGMINN